MPTLTLSIPDELKKRIIDARPEVNWPEVLRAALERRVDELLKFEELKKKGLV